jgi:hypothetical protein
MDWLKDRRIRSNLNTDEYSQSKNFVQAGQKLIFKLSIGKESVSLKNVVKQHSY